MNVHLSDRSLRIARSLLIIGGTAAIIVGATYAQTQLGTATMTGNTFSAYTTTANTSGNILISPNGNTGNFTSNMSGFNFGSIGAGGNSSVNHFWLQNNSSSAATVTFSASSLSGFGNLSPSSVIVNIERTGTSTNNALSLASLSSNTATLSNPPSSGGGIAEYNIWLTLNSTATTNQGYNGSNRYVYNNGSGSSYIYSSTNSGRNGSYTTNARFNLSFTGTPTTLTQ